MDRQHSTHLSQDFEFNSGSGHVNSDFRIQIPESEIWNPKSVARLRRLAAKRMRNAAYAKVILGALRSVSRKYFGSGYPTMIG
jgi:hypothetical protein